MTTGLICDKTVEYLDMMLATLEQDISKYSSSRIITSQILTWVEVFLGMILFTASWVTFIFLTVSEVVNCLRTANIVPLQVVLNDEEMYKKFEELGKA